MEYLETIEDMKERFSIMVESGVSIQEARNYVLSHTSQKNKATAIFQGLFYE